MIIPIIINHFETKAPPYIQIYKLCFGLNAFVISNYQYGPTSLDTARSLGGFAVRLFLEVSLIQQKRDHPIAGPQNQVLSWLI